MPTHWEVLEMPLLRRQADGFARDVARGLSRRPKAIPSVYFYDAAGSALFGQITELEEYYLTRCELEILRNCAPHIARLFGDAPFRLVELGVGDGRKTRLLLQQFLADGLRFEYFPIDICRQTILGLGPAFRGVRPGQTLRVRGIVADYVDGLALLGRQQVGRNLVLFLGSSIGNFSQHRARHFLTTLRQALRGGDYALLGFDLKKDVPLLQRAYDDSAGVTREFNFNLLDRINRELGGRFDRRRFRHHAAYNPRQECMESWLLSTEAQDVLIGDLGRVFSFRAWEGIHLESSFKYDVSGIEALAAASGFRVCRHFFDSRRYFVDSLWQANGRG